MYKSFFFYFVGLFITTCSLAVTSCKKDEIIPVRIVSGRIFNKETGEPVQSAKVELWTLQEYEDGYYGDPLQAQVTGSEGTYEFTNLPQLTDNYKYYGIEVTAEGYDLVHRTFNTANTKQDFLLPPSENAVIISPTELTIGDNVTVATFTIKNNKSSSVQYSIFNYEDIYLSISPTSATIKSHGKQAVSVGYKKDAVTSDLSTTILANIDGNTYPIKINIKSSPSNLLIGKWYLQYCYEYSPSDSYQFNWGDGEYMDFRSDGTMYWYNRIYGLNTRYQYSLSNNVLRCVCILNNVGESNSIFDAQLRVSSQTSSSLKLYDEEYGFYRYLTK